MTEVLLEADIDRQPHGRFDAAYIEFDMTIPPSVTLSWTRYKTARLNRSCR
jgi:hypothetical protein